LFHVTYSPVLQDYTLYLTQLFKQFLQLCRKKSYNRKLKLIFVIFLILGFLKNEIKNTTKFVLILFFVSTHIFYTTFGMETTKRRTVHCHGFGEKEMKNYQSFHIFWNYFWRLVYTQNQQFMHLQIT
jgi:hypothetical protein